MGNPRYASGRLSNAICDRCGLRFPYLSLRTEPETKEQVCAGCLDQRYPYWAFARPADAQSLRKPRPEEPLPNAVPPLTDEEWENR